MKTKFNKIVSFLLVLTMLFSIFPANVFGYEEVNFDVNSGSGVVTDASSGLAVGWGGINEDNFHGMVFSLYFAEGEWANTAEFNKACAVKPSPVKWQQLGETIYMVKENKLNKTDNLYSNRSVFRRMANCNWDVTIWQQDWTSKATGIQYYNFKGEFPELFKNQGKDKYVKFFTGLTAKELAGEKGQENWQKADLTNVEVVTNKILRNAEYKITQDQFKQGFLKKAVCSSCESKGFDSCQGHYGVYKLYFEPMIRVGIGSSWYVMTVRDFCAWQRFYPNQKFGVGGETYIGIAVASTTPLLKIGNETYLVTNEPQINMQGHTGGIFEMHYKFDNTKPFFKSAGVGVITSLPSKSIQRPQLIKTYVSIDSVDADGNVTFKKARPTTIEDAPFYFTAEFNYTDLPIFYDYEVSTDESSVAVLNDIFTTDKDLQISSSTEWVNTELITNTGSVKLQPTAEDIAGYKFGIVTSSNTFIKSLQKNSSHEGSISQGVEALMDYYKKIQSANINASNENISFVNIGLGDSSYETTQIVNAIEYTHHMSDIQPRLTDADVAALKADEDMELVKAGMLTKDDGVVKITDELLQKIAAETGTPIEIETPSNHVVLRYIVKPNPSQVDLVEIRDKATNELKGVLVGEPQPLDISGDKAKIQDPNVEGLGAYKVDPEVVEWNTNSEYPVLDLTDDIPDMSTGGKTGTTRDDIPGYPKDPLTHNLYVKWVIYEEVKVDNTPPHDVPEWRLSRYFPTVKNGPGIVGTILSTIHTDNCHCGCKAGMDEGKWNWKGAKGYELFNPNGTKIDTNGPADNTPAKMKLEGERNWIHTRAIDLGDSDSISFPDGTAEVQINANLNAVKSDTTAYLNLANWKGSALNSGGNDYDINAKSKPETATVSDVYTLSNSVTYWTENIWDYKNWWYECLCYDKRVGSGSNRRWVHVHRCLYHEHILNEGRELWVPQLSVTFDRYNAENTDARLLKVKPEIKEENGFTTLKYQLTDRINIYPEIGMIFDTDNNVESIKWVVGEEKRAIQPVVWQTLQHKVFVVPNSTGTSVVNDSRAVQSSNQLAMSDATAKGKQIIYKGAAANTAFRVYRDKDYLSNNSKGILTVKTYALDFADKDKTNNIDVKAEWGNSAYDSLKQHTTLINSIKDGTNKADTTEKLLIDSPNFGNLDYTGGVRSQKSGTYNLIKYSNPNAVDGGNGVEFEHKLIIRGGHLIGVVIQDRATLNYGSPIKIEDLETMKNEEALYNAIVNMNLYSKDKVKNKTVFSTFEHKVGKASNDPESDYAAMLHDARKTMDGIDTPTYAKVENGQGWYSEDTTVLIIKEYVSNFEVPSISYSDKISMSVNGLNTPANKTQFFNTLGKGHTYLKYNLPVTSPYAGVPNVNAYFEYTSFKGDGLDEFGRQGVDYIVPNVSVSDTTRIN